MRADSRTHGQTVILVGNSRFPQFCEGAIPEKTIGVLNQEIRILRTGMHYVYGAQQKRIVTETNLSLLQITTLKYSQMRKKIMHINMQPLIKN